MYTRMAKNKGTTRTEITVQAINGHYYQFSTKVSARSFSDARKIYCNACYSTVVQLLRVLSRAHTYIGHSSVCAFWCGMSHLIVASIGHYLAGPSRLDDTTWAHERTALWFRVELYACARTRQRMATKSNGEHAELRTHRPNIRQRPATQASKTVTHANKNFFFPKCQLNRLHHIRLTELRCKSMRQMLARSGQQRL